MQVTGTSDFLPRYGLFPLLRTPHCLEWRSLQQASEYRRKIVELVRAWRKPPELSREYVHLMGGKAGVWKDRAARWKGGVYSLIGRCYYKAVLARTVWFPHGGLNHEWA